MEGIKGIIEDMKQHGMEIPAHGVSVYVPDGKTVLTNCFRYFLFQLGKEFAYKQEYDEVADWLSDNKRRGLLLYGNCGQGKTLLSRFVLPAILLKYCGKVVNYYDMTQVNHKIDEVLSKHILSIDDVGTESLSVQYGNKRNAFDEIMDSVEKKGKLIIVTTNLTSEELSEKYGERVMDRIISTTRRILFTGESLRS